MAGSAPAQSGASKSGIGTFAIQLAKHLGGIVGTVKADWLEKALRIVKPVSALVSLIGPADPAVSHRRQLAGIGGLLAQGRIRPVIDRVFPFAQAREGLAYLDAGRASGKVVVRLVDE